MRFLLRRVFVLVPVLFVVSFLTFILMNLLPGGPEVNFLGVLTVNDLSVCDDPGIDTSLIEGCRATKELRAKLDLDEPLLVRYATWAGNALTGDLGTSYVSKFPVLDTIQDRLPTSVALMLYAQLIAFTIAIPVALLAAYRPGGWFDRVSASLSFGIIAVAVFIMALLLQFIFAAKLGWFPVRYDSDAEFAERAKGMFLPAAALGLGLGAVYARLLRGDLVATLQEDFILMAKAKGMPGRRIMLRHALRPSTFSLLTVMGIQVGALIGGALVVEQIFLVPGIGFILTEAIFRRDYQLVQGIILVLAAIYVLTNFVVDVVYGMLDPRVRDARSR
ncbi:MAG: ABC transporter permease [Actinomycetota bacterium]